MTKPTVKGGLAPANAVEVKGRGCLCWELQELTLKGAGGGVLARAAGKEDCYSTMQVQRWFRRYGALVNATSVTSFMPRSWRALVS